MKTSVWLRLNERIAVGALIMAVVPWAQAADPASQAKPAVPVLVQQMEGNWTVSQKMWPGHAQAAVDLPAAVARRRLIQASFLEEVMEPAQTDTSDSFNRTSYFEFNSTTHKFEYFSIDSRLPQMMNERSAAMDPTSTYEGVKLEGSHFVAPTWGKAKNVPFRYRLAVGDVKADRQTVQLFLTPESGKDRQEFMAFEYVYVRTP